MALRTELNSSFGLSFNSCVSLRQLLSFLITVLISEVFILKSDFKAFIT